MASAEFKFQVSPTSHSSQPCVAETGNRMMASFEVNVAKDDFKFHAAHFVAFEGYRERLHGHNYKAGVRLLGSNICRDGYVVDFGNIKTVTRKVCKELNDHFLCPMQSDVIDVTVSEKTSVDGAETVTLVCQDGSRFVFPKSDCALLPIVHATSEELAIYLWSRILSGLSASYLLERGVHTMEVTIAEAVGQEAVFRLAIPNDFEQSMLDVKTFIKEGKVNPVPCPVSSPEKAVCGGKSCQSCTAELQAKLEKLALALNEKAASGDSLAEITASELNSMLD